MPQSRFKGVWKRVKRRRLIVAAAAIVLGAIVFMMASGTTQFKRHDGFGRSCADIHEATGAQAKCVSLYFGTPRKVRPAKAGEKAQGHERVAGFGNGLDRTLHLGRAEVSLPYLVSDLYPEGRKRGVVDHATQRPPRTREETERYVAITTISKTAREVFVSDLAGAVSKNDEAVLLFIHGYNVDFDSAVIRAAQLAVDLTFDENAPPGEDVYDLGQPVLFSWPNGARTITYPADRSLAKNSAPYLKDFLELLTRQSGARNFNVVVHSMGNRVLVNAIADFAQDYADWAGDDVTFRIIHAAADVDQGVYDKEMDKVEKSDFEAEYTIYASKTDAALNTSRQVNALTSFFRTRNGRLGQISEEGIYIREPMTSIDASDFGTDLFGHGYFSNTGNVVKDMACVFHGVEPARRALVPRRKGALDYYEMDASRNAHCLPSDPQRFAADAQAYAAAHEAGVARAREAGVYARATASSLAAGRALSSVFDPRCPDGAPIPAEGPCPAVDEEPDPTPPPPTPDEEARGPKELTVYFAFDSAALSEEARALIDAAYGEARASGEIAQIFIAGHADRAGGEAHNQQLSLARADAVRERMMRLGAPRDRIFLRGLGENDLASATPDEVRDPANRRAVIVISFRQE